MPKELVSEYIRTAKVLISFWKAQMPPTVNAQSNFAIALTKLRYHLDRMGCKMPQIKYVPVDLENN